MEKRAWKKHIQGGPGPQASPPAEKTKYTPGPWRTDFNHYDNQWRVYEENGPPIINSLFKPYGEIGKNNARLIAAAPDLLEELKKAVDRFDLVMFEDPKQEKKMERCKRIMQNCYSQGRGPRIVT